MERYSIFQLFWRSSHGGVRRSLFVHVTASYRSYDWAACTAFDLSLWLVAMAIVATASKDNERPHGGLLQNQSNKRGQGDRGAALPGTLLVIPPINAIKWTSVHAGDDSGLSPT